MAVLDRKQIEGPDEFYLSHWDRDMRETALLAHDLRLRAEWMFRVIGDALDRGIHLAYLNPADYEQTREVLAKFPEEKDDGS